VARRSHQFSEVAPLLIGIQSSPERDLSLDSLAAEHGYSPSHFHRLFTATVGETPKAHVERIRLERAAYRLSVTRESVLDIALSLGFQNHETFSRAFRRHFDHTPTAWRRESLRGQKQRMDAMKGFRGDGCTLSEVSFLTLKPLTLLAMRRIGPYGTLGPPRFDGAPSEWSPLLDVAARWGLEYRKLGIIICYDDPTITPPDLQHLDACVPLTSAAGAPTRGAIKRLDFAGGLYGAIEHRGSVRTLIQAYRTLADGIRRSGRCVFRREPPMEIIRELPRGRTPALSEIYFPVEPKQ
jgi:AraC family transcriptional regulator